MVCLPEHYKITWLGTEEGLGCSSDFAWFFQGIKLFDFSESVYPRTRAGLGCSSDFALFFQGIKAGTVR